MHVIRGGQVADVDGTREADVAVADGEIVAVGPDAVDEIGGEDAVDAETDASGSVVASGLIDAHVHVMMDGRPDVATAVSDSDYTASYRTAGNLRDALEAGSRRSAIWGPRDARARRGRAGGRRRRHRRSARPRLRPQRDHDRRPRQLVRPRGRRSGRGPKGGPRAAEGGRGRAQAWRRAASLPRAR